MKPQRFTPIAFQNGKTLRNRLVLPPMASQTATLDGSVTPATLAHYERLARSGAGLLMVEYTAVHPTGRSEPNQLGIQHDDQIEGLAQLARILHRSGALAGIQLSHGGGKSSRDLTGGALMGPSAIPVPVRNETLEVPDAMNGEQVELWRNAFLQAARRAVLAGFDWVELHSAHGYGLNQWISPLTNQRTDEYGGDLKNRARLLLEVISSIRQAYPELLISVRMPGQDFLEGGLTPEDGITLARMLESAGVDVLHVSSGIGGWRRPRDRVGEGYLVAEAARIQRNVEIPVIGVGGIETAEYIESGLEEGWFTLAAVGRKILADPDAFRLVFAGSEAKQNQEAFNGQPRSSAEILCSI